MSCTNSKSRRSPRVNLSWLPLKVHYFLMYGGMAASLNFTPIIAKDLGLSVAAVGISYSFQPLGSFFFKPVAGYLADYAQNTKKLIMIGITMFTALSLCLQFINPIKDYANNCLEVKLQCIDNDEGHKIQKISFDEPCIMNSFSDSTLSSCNISYYELSTSNSTCVKARSTDLQINLNYSVSTTHVDVTDNKCKINRTHMKCLIQLEDSAETKSVCKESDTLTMTCDDKIEKCLASKKEINFYYTYQFWLFNFIIVSRCCFGMMAVTLTDVSCQELLGEKRHYFGRQRLWGTVSVGTITLLSGFCIDLSSRVGERTDFSAVYYVLSVIFILNVISSIKLYLPKANFSPNIISDAINSFKSTEVIVFGIACFLIGVFSSFIHTFLFWYLKDLGASETLLGLTTATECLVGEVLFFFFSGWFVKRLGHFNCLTLSFAAFAIRFGVYSLLQDPWFVLAVEAFHGITYGVFFASLVSFASEFAAQGTEATVFSFLTGIYDSLGVAIGSLVGGLCFSSLGGRQTFLITSCVCLLCAVATFISQIHFKKHRWSQVKTSEGETQLADFKSNCNQTATSNA